MRAGADASHFPQERHRFKAKNDAMQNQRCIDDAGRSLEAYGLTVCGRAGCPPRAADRHLTL
jgi:hypothetical protein